MKNYFKFILLGLMIFVIILILSLNINNYEREDTQQVCLRNNCFQVEIADNSIERQQGLMFREQLDKDKGMLFIFDEEGIYPFWMKNTLIPLDMIWINEDKEIVYIENNAQPCKEEVCTSYNPNANARYVFEINSGLTNELGIKIGNKLDFR